MPTDKANGVATPEEFRKAADSAKVAPDRVVLPKSGLAVMLRRPTSLWFLFNGRLPMSLAARRQQGGTGQIETAEQFIEFSKWMVKLLEEVFVEPKLSLDPGVNEISPEWLDDEDANFIVRWAVGEVTPDGRGDLAEFRGERKSAAACASGGDLPPLAERATEDGPDGFSN